VYGFDVILDEQLQPMLLEVNVLPSLSSSSELDKRIKTAVMSDTFNLIGVVPYSAKTLEKQSSLKHWEKFTGLVRDCESQIYTSAGIPHVEGRLRATKEIVSDFKNCNREEQLVVVEILEEFSRKGNWDLIYPRTSTTETY
jgi:hypothetical protein